MEIEDQKNIEDFIFNKNEIKAIRNYEDEIFNLEDVKIDIKVESIESAKEALSIALRARKLEKQIEERRIEITIPVVKMQRNINEYARELKNRISIIEEDLTLRLQEWISVQNENPFTEIESIEVLDGTLSVKKYWNYEIIDKEKIPERFFVLDEKLLKEEILIGVRNIEGIKIFEDEKIIMRVKN